MGSPAPASSGHTLSSLSEFDIILVGDASGSMSLSVSKTNTKSRWDYQREAFLGLAAEVGRIDEDGLGLVLFGGTNIGPPKSDGLTIAEITAAYSERRPAGGTPLHTALERAFSLAGKSDKKDLIIVFTDGVPDDKKAVENLIRAQAAKQETDDELTILFIQVGDDAEASAYLRRLDDDLTGIKFDIVDVKTIDEVDNYPSILALINDAISG